MKFAADFKKLALNALKGNWPMAMLTGYVATLMGASLVTFAYEAQTSGSSTESIMQKLKSSEIWPAIAAGLFIAFIILVIWAIALFIIAGPAKLGYAVFNLKLTDGKPVDLKDLFSQFNRIGAGFAMNFLVGLFTSLWSLLFVIPGIIKSYSYAMTPYILAENPQLTANESITESRRVMKGNKWRLFCLHFSFIGWDLLCTMPLFIALVAAVYSIANTGDYIAALYLIPGMLISFIGNLFLHPYKEAAQAAFYRDITVPKVTVTTEATANNL